MNSWAKPLDGSNYMSDVFSSRRERLKKEYGNNGYKKCGVWMYEGQECGTPIRPKLWVNPIGQISVRKTPDAVPLRLRMM